MNGIRIGKKKDIQTAYFLKLLKLLYDANQVLKKVFFYINGLEIFAIIIWQYGIYTNNAQF
jgi:hypothetical protein